MKRQRTELNILNSTTAEVILPLYDRFKTPPLHTPYRLENGEHIELTLHHAGHVAGAVSVSVKYKGKTTFFTGDILFNDQRTLDGANLPKEPVDILVTETTRVPPKFHKINLESLKSFGCSRRFIQRSQNKAPY